MYLNTLFGNGLNSKILSLKEPLANITWHSGNCSDCEMAFKHFKSANDVQLTEYNLKFQGSVRNLQKKGTFCEVLPRNPSK